MKKFLAILLTSVCTLSFGSVAFAKDVSKPIEAVKAPVVVTSTKEAKAVSAAIDHFYSALNTLFTGNGQAMKDAWSHADDVTYMGPDGLYLTGWGNIEKMWNSVAAQKLGGRVMPQKMHTVIGSDMALVNCVEVGENKVNGKTETVSIRSSTVLSKRDGTWKVIAHQTDLLGYMK